MELRCEELSSAEITVSSDIRGATISGDHEHLFERLLLCLRSFLVNQLNTSSNGIYTLQIQSSALAAIGMLLSGAMRSLNCVDPLELVSNYYLQNVYTNEV